MDAQVSHNYHILLTAVQQIKATLTAHLFKQMRRNFVLQSQQVGKLLTDRIAIYEAPHMDVFLLVVFTPQQINSAVL
jgi:hypothetical protein